MRLVVKLIAKAVKLLLYGISYTLDIFCFSSLTFSFALFLLLVLCSSFGFYSFQNHDILRLFEFCTKPMLLWFNNTDAIEHKMTHPAKVCERESQSESDEPNLIKLFWSKIFICNSFMQMFLLYSIVHVVVVPVAVVIISFIFFSFYSSLSFLIRFYFSAMPENSRSDFFICATKKKQQKIFGVSAVKKGVVEWIKKIIQ